MNIRYYNISSVWTIQLLTFWCLVILVVACNNTHRLYYDTGNNGLVEVCDATVKQHAATTPVPRTHEAWMERHKAIVEMNKHRKVEMIFLGNSITQRWERQGAEAWSKYYGKRNAVNMGFDGDGTQNVLWRIDHGELDGISPQLAVVMIGSNHVNGSSPTEIADGIKAVCCRIRRKLPRTKILLMAILPRGDASAAGAYRLNKASEEASRIVDNKNIYYLNISEKFLDENGNVSDSLMTIDGVHLSSDGYNKLAIEMEPMIVKILDRH